MVGTYLGSDTAVKGKCLCVNIFSSFRNYTRGMVLILQEWNNIFHDSRNGTIFGTRSRGEEQYLAQRFENNICPILGVEQYLTQQFEENNIWHNDSRSGQMFATIR